ncbi:MAG: hypothetical protein IJD51_04690 [Clostridia bacterium]|nr:hypothetical protein [Clostridia bacterium]
MKRILSLLLCLTVLVLTLASCGADEFEDGPAYSQKTDELGTVNVTLYIIKGDDMSDNAEDTVRRQILATTESELNTKLTVEYLTLAEYETKVTAAIAEKGVVVPVEEETDKAPSTEGAQHEGGAPEAPEAPEEEEEKPVPDGMIVLVHSSAFMDTISSTGKLVDISEYLATKSFGTLNNGQTIPTALLSAAKNADGKLLALPNNRVLGEYTYLSINKEVAMQQLKYSEDTLKSYNSYADTIKLRQDMEALGINPNLYVSVVPGTYATRYELEASGNFCKSIAVPTITRDDAFDSAFAIVNTGDDRVNERAMKIIYELNTNASLRNLLQFGVENTNYTVITEKDEVTDEIIYSNIILETDDDKYRMNYLYTGNVFVLDFCEEIGWNAERKEVGLAQNAEVIFKAN